MNWFKIAILFAFCASSSPAFGQKDSLQIPHFSSVPKKYLRQVDNKVDKYEKRISGKSVKTLEKLSKWESKLQRILAKTDPSLRDKLFGKNSMTFSTMLAKYKNGESLAKNSRMKYDEYRDKLNMSISYVESKQKKAENAIVTPIQETKQNLDALGEKVKQTESLEDLIRKRKKELAQAALKSVGKNKYLDKINKEAWYYTATLKNYKDIFSDPTKLEAKVTQELNKIPAFQSFMKQNSQLAKLFKMPDNYGSEGSLAGLQTSTQVNGLINDKLAAGGPSAKQIFQQNMQKAQSELAKLKADLVKKGNIGGGGEMPDFKPNMQKTKTLPQRLEYGFNLQFGKGSSFLPSSSELGFSIGYKLNDRSIVGVGASYRIGLGSIQKIKFTHEGLGLRSFLDYKLKKQFYLTGGAEANMQAGLKRIPGLNEHDKWSPSALLGISKTIPLRTKISKASKLQLMYDFLHHKYPARQAWVFRVGYSF